MSFRDKVVLITGASEGIGAACARAFAGRGARLALVARSAGNLKLVAAADDLPLAGDLLDPEFRCSAVDRTVERFGRIDVLINNAGVGLYVPAHRAPLEEVRRMFELNFFAALDLAQRAIPHMRRQGGGAIVNLSSIAGKMTLPWFTLYSASKYAVGSLTDGLRMELRRDRIHTMTVCPGYVKTRFQDHVLAGNAPPLEGLRASWAITPEKVAHDLISGLERRARTVVTPRSGWVLIAAARMFPSFLDSRLEKLHRKQEAASP